MFKEGDIIGWNIFLLPFMEHWLMIVDLDENDITQSNVIHYNTEGRYVIEKLDIALKRSWRTVEHIKIIYRTNITKYDLYSNIHMIDQFIELPYDIIYHSCQDFMSYMVMILRNKILWTQYERNILIVMKMLYIIEY